MTFGQVAQASPPAGVIHGAATQPATQPVMTPQQELDWLLQAAKNWNTTSPAHNRQTNECYEQAVNLMDHLRSLKPKYWQPNTEGGWNGVPRYGLHHVTLLEPKHGNPMSPMVFDAFKRPGSNSTNVKLMSGAAFRNLYPYDCGENACRNHYLPPESAWWLLLEVLAAPGANN